MTGMLPFPLPFPSFSRAFGLFLVPSLLLLPLVFRALLARALLRAAVRSIRFYAELFFHHTIRPYNTGIGGLSRPSPASEAEV